MGPAPDLSRLGEPWTQADDRVLCDLRRRGLHDKAIGLAVHRTAKAVKRRRQVLRLVRRARKIDRGKLLELHAAGMTTDQIARELKATPRTVGELRWRLLRGKAS